MDRFDGEGEAWDEIVNAINKRRVTQVAIIGYSYGGGATYQLAERLSRDIFNEILAPYSLVFTSYIDAIERPLRFAEEHRPPGTLYHLNQYQRNVIASTGLIVHGAGGCEIVQIRELHRSWCDPVGNCSPVAGHSLCPSATTTSQSLCKHRSLTIKGGLLIITRSGPDNQYVRNWSGDRAILRPFLSR